MQRISLVFIFTLICLTSCNKSSDEDSFYSCTSTGICIEDSNGTYTSLQACQSLCGSNNESTNQFYSCTNNTCIEDSAGIYTSLNACLSECQGEGENEIADHLNPNIQYGTVVDSDGNTYFTVIVAEQEWMAENLRTTKFCNGEPISLITNNSSWANTESAGWCFYNNNGANDYPFGKLYNWYTVNDDRNICPCGWHVPTDADWSLLVETFGGNETAGNALCSDGTEYWGNGNTANNESGFSGLPGGRRIFNGTFYEMGFEEGYIGTWWTSTPAGDIGAWNRSLYGGNTVGMSYSNKATGVSIRCIKD